MVCWPGPCQPLYVPAGPSTSTQCPSHLFWTHVSHTHSEDAALVCHMAVHLVIHLLHALTVAWHTHDHPCTLGPPFQTSHRSPHMSLAARPTCSWLWLSPSYAQPKCLHAFTHSLTPRVHSCGPSTPLAHLTHLACIYILSLTLCHLHMPLTHLSPQPCPCCPGGPPAHTHCTPACIHLAFPLNSHFRFVPHMPPGTCILGHTFLHTPSHL